jgi:hypothetical protein
MPMLDQVRFDPDEITPVFGIDPATLTQVEQPTMTDTPSPAGSVTFGYTHRDRLLARDLLTAANVAHDARDIASVASILPVHRKALADALRSECDPDVDTDLLQLADRIEAGELGNPDGWTE